MNSLNKLLLLALFLFILPGKASSHVALDYPAGGETFQAGETVTIEWHVIISHGPANWDLSYSLDGGSTWQPLAANLEGSLRSYDWTLPNQATDSARVRVVQDNAGGTDYSDSSGNFTIEPATAIRKSRIRADNFQLFSAYPNPFNSTTLISFYLPEESPLRITVFTPTGQKVAELLNEALPAGTHHVQWNAEGLSTGVYLYRISGNGISEIRKVVYIK